MKYLPKILATYKGHIDQEVQGLPSTKDSPDEDIAHKKVGSNFKTQDLITSIVSLDGFQSRSYSDQSEKLSGWSSHGSIYIFVFYHFDINVV